MGSFTEGGSYFDVLPFDRFIQGIFRVIWPFFSFGRLLIPYL